MREISCGWFVIDEFGGMMSLTTVDIRITSGYLAATVSETCLKRLVPLHSRQ